MSETVESGVREAVTHTLKVWPSFFGALESGAKTFEIRKNDRDFRKGDTLRLCEFDANKGEFTDKRPIERIITYVFGGGHFGVAPDYCVLGLAPLSRTDSPASEDAIHNAAVREAAQNLLPYLRWTIGPESPGHHPTMPSAVAALESALRQEKETI